MITALYRHSGLSTMEAAASVVMALLQGKPLKPLVFKAVPPSLLTLYQSQQSKPALSSKEGGTDDMAGDASLSECQLSPAVPDTAPATTPASAASHLTLFAHPPIIQKLVVFAHHGEVLGAVEDRLVQANISFIR